MEIESNRKRIGVSLVTLLLGKDWQQKIAPSYGGSWAIRWFYVTKEVAEECKIMLDVEHSRKIVFSFFHQGG